MRRVAAAAAFVSSFALAHIARAQSLSGTVRDSVSHLPLPGAVVMLLDSAGSTVARNLTNERGEYRVRLNLAARRVRFVRIGFAPSESPIPRQDGRLDVSMLPVPSMLGTVLIRANSHCPVRKDRNAALGLWEQARAGLLATVVAREANPARIVRLGFERVMDGNSDRIESMRVRAGAADTATTSFFAAHTAEELVQTGFTTAAPNGVTFFGPDADVLLNDYFAGAYCLELANGGRSRPHQIGLHFVPADHQKGRIDIEGSLWIDTVARALNDIEFRYLGMPAAAVRFSPGGHVSFREMANGVVLIDRWSLRLVSGRVDTVVVSHIIGGGLAARDVLYADETGGELARATWPDGTDWHAPLGALRVITLNHEGQPAVGAVLALPATDYFGIADAHGIVDIRDLLPGPYSVRVIDPEIADLGIGIPTAIKFMAARDTTTLARLIVPTATSFAVERCTANGYKVNLRSGPTFAVLGRVVTPDGKPAAGVTVSVATIMLEAMADGTKLSWAGHPMTTGSDGLFQACHNWDPRNEVLIRIQRPGMPDMDVEAQFGMSSVLAKKIVVPFP